MSSQLSFKPAPSVPPAPKSRPQAIAPHEPAVLTLHAGASEAPAEARDVLPATMQRLVVARARILEAARAGQRVRTYEVALDLDMSEFHFARQFRLAFDRSPHVYYDEVRAETARELLAQGLAEGLVARRIGFRRPAELRALLAKRPAGTLPGDLAR